MIRAAGFGDLQRIAELVREMHGRSIYAEEPLSEKLVRSILLDGVRRHGGHHAGATLLNVSEFRGQLEGFMFGMLQPIYNILETLEAMDVWLYTSPKSPGIAASRLIDEYVAWTDANPRVREVRLSWSDAVSVDAAKLEKLYGRKGFQRCGGMFRRVRP
jgi:hypothetical protein